MRAEYSKPQAGGESCGVLTGVMPLSLYRAWIVETARKFNSPVGP